MLCEELDFFNRDVMFGNDCFQLNDKHIDDALQWHNIAQKGWDVCSPQDWDLGGDTAYQRGQGNQ